MHDFPEDHINDSVKSSLEGLDETIHRSLEESLSGLDETINDSVQAAMDGARAALDSARASMDLGELEEGVAGDEVEDEVVDRQYDAGDRPELIVGNVSGDIVVVADDERTIRVHATKRGSSSARGNTRIELGQQGERVTVRTRGNEVRRFRAYVGNSMSSVDYQIRVPRSCRVRAKGISSDVRVEGLRAPATVETVSGDIRATDIRADCTLTSVSGDVVAERIVGELGLRTTSGDARIHASEIRSFSVNTVSGDVTVESPLNPGSTYTARTVSGDLRLIVPPNTGATVQMKSMSGDAIVSGLQADVVKSGRRRWQGMINGGGANVEMNSLSGDLRISSGSGEGMHRPHVPHTPHAPAAPDAPDAPPAPTAEPQKPSPTVAILDQLQRGEITIEDAMKRLENLS